MPGSLPPLPASVPDVPFPQSGLISSFVSFGLFATGSIPPDPIGAAGPSHLVNVVNTNIAFYQKNGLLDSAVTLSSFFAGLAPLTSTFDPKVLYDTVEERFVVISLEATSAPLTSRILIAVSDDSNPNGTWHQTAVNSLVSISGNTFADYPGLAVDEDAIYISANMF